MFYCCLLFIFFNARSSRSVGRSPRNFASWLEACLVYKCRSKNLDRPPKKIGAKNTLNLARFRTPSHFKREYLRNGQKYPKSKNYLIDSISSCFRRRKFGELWSTNFGDLEVQLYTQNQLFRNTIFRPLGDAASRNSYTRYRMSKSC